MKGIIMAGGIGSRLKPLTCSLPKPMVPVMNRPIMEYTVELLKKYGIEQIGVTLQYLPRVIQDYFGDGSDWEVNLHYFLEEVPLGTAGSVKNTGNFLDETFVVVSGDALTDINIRKAVEFHKRKRAIATLVLKRVDVPLDYGVVVTDKEGLITRFLEKPSWGELFSDTANTGIYILEPEALKYFEAGHKFDFSQNLFPMLLAERKAIYGFVTDEYWCDVGNPKAYMQAHCDILDGLLSVKLPGLQTEENARTEASARIAQSAVIEGPCYIGNYSRIGSGVHIGPYTVIGDHCNIGENSTVERSVFWKNCITGKSINAQGAIICKNVYMQNNVSVGEGAIVGDNCNLSENCIIKSDVKLWPDKWIEQSALVQSNVIWSFGIKKALFGSKGIAGRVNIDLDSQFAARLGVAYRSYALGCMIDTNGEEIQLFESGESRLKGETLSALTNLVYLMDGTSGDLAVPFNAPQAMEKMAERFNRKIVRTKTGLHAVMEEMLKLQLNNKHKDFGSFILRYDAIAFLLRLLEIMCKEQKTLKQLISFIPDFHMIEKSINCPWKDKGRVIRSLMEEVDKTGHSVELFEGIKINHEKGWALILPDSDKPLCRVYSDGFSEEYAEELCKFYEGKILRLTGQ